MLYAGSDPCIDACKAVTGEGNSRVEPRASRQAKDHVFVDMFNQPKYCLELFNALHPEATDITEADIENISISHVIVDKPYNDLGFTVKGKQFILVEAQSSWSYNILVRLMLYFADTLLGIIKDHEDWDVHDTAKLPLPSPEFYVIYTGDRRNVPNQISFRRDFYRDDSVPFDLEARVISTESTDDIIGQYIIYAHVYDQQVKKYGYQRSAAEETVRICKDRGILKDYLEAHEKEVINSMIMLFEQEESVKRYGRRIAREARIEGKLAAYADMVTDGTLTIEKAAEKMGMTAEAFKDAVEALKVTA